MDDRTNTDPVRILMFASLLLVAIYVPFYIATLRFPGGIPRDGTTLVVGRDFLNLWMYGRAAQGADPARYYDMATYWRALAGIVGPDYPGQQWSYPPTALLVGAPFGGLPYLPALLLWTVAGIAAFFHALRLWTRDWRVIIPLLLSPAALFGLISGQFAFFGAAVILATLNWRESRPVLAGVLLGLLTVKPQLGLLFPVMLLATRNWRVIGAATLTALALAALAAAIWGIETWHAYVTTGIGNQSLILSDPESLAGPFMPTLFMNLRSAGLPLHVAASCQGLLALIAIGLVWHVFRRRPSSTDLRANAIFLACTLSCTPYMLSYDTLSLTVIAVLLMADGQGRRSMLLLFLLPLIQIVAGTLGIPGPALIAMAAALYLARPPSMAQRTNAMVN
jgi:arabinofuranan 3-O-arabinosyltransferase